ncbi:MAG: SIMPL domain-containing protein [Aestuariivirgaceae bacterium]
MRNLPYSLAALTCLATIFLAVPALGDERPPPLRILSMVGHGKVNSPPDMALVTLGVLREAKTARAALTANNEAMRNVIATVTKAGVAEKDIQTSGFSVQPKYVYPKQASTGERKPPRIIGYTVSNNVTVIVRNLDSLGAVLDGVVGAGSNQINGISFSIAEPRPLRNEARKLATADAIAKAALYAEAAGVELGPIQSISEQGSIRPPQPVLRQARTMALEADAAVPVARGEQSVEMQVHITWQIK